MEPSDIELPPRPDLKITIGDREIKMTYGLEMDIRRMLPDPSSAMRNIQTDPFTQDYIIRRILTPKKGLVTNLSDLVSMDDIDDIDVSPDDLDRMITWAVEHALYFFVKRAVEIAQLGARYQKALPQPSPAGSES